MTRCRPDLEIGRTLALAVCAAAFASLAAVATAQSPTFAAVGTIKEHADLIDVRDGRAYLAAGKTLTVVDVSNPAAPVRGGSHTFPEKIWGFKVVGSLVYVAADFFGLGILDVSNIAKPVLRGSFKTPGQAKNVAVVGTKVALADHMSGVDFVDVSNPAKLVSLGSFFLDGYARDVAAAGPNVYAIDAPTGLYVFDLTKPGTPIEPISTQQSATAPGSIELSDASASQKLACLLGAGSLQIYDISKPGAPARVGTIRMPAARRVTVQGSFAYVADARAGLQVVDLSNPAAPRLAASFKTSSPGRDVAVAGPLVFVATGVGEASGEVVILRQN
jgi:hypothetical protein